MNYENCGFTYCFFNQTHAYGKEYCEKNCPRMDEVARRAMKPPENCVNRIHCFDCNPFCPYYEDDGYPLSSGKERKVMTEFEKMTQLLEASWVMRSQIVPCLVGPPGIGKTAAVMQHAKRHGSKVVKIVASRCVPSETVGMTMPNHEHRSMEIYNSMQLTSLRDGDILFLDELLEADQYVLSTLLTVIESREMADGTPLPDIQIIAATNDTISPEQLKGNIRQRFMFQRFYVDLKQTKEYIVKVTGIELSHDILSKVCDSGTDYNFLTPRSLTKLCLWLARSDDDDRVKVAEVINDMWKSSLGTSILHCLWNVTPETQVRTYVTNRLEGRTDVNVEEFEDCTFSELLETLRGLEDWEEIEKDLANMRIEEKDDGQEIKF